LVHALEVEDDAAMEGDGLSIVAGASSTEGDGDFVLVAIAKDGEDLFGVEGLDDDVGVLAVELRFEDGRVPVEVAREAFDDLGLREDSRCVAEEIGEICCKVLHGTASARVSGAR
jgi:hypothetical protein